MEKLAYEYLLVEYVPPSLKWWHLVIWKGIAPLVLDFFMWLTLKTIF